MASIKQGIIPKAMLDSLTKEQLYDSWQKEKGNYLDIREKFEAYQREMNKKISDYEKVLAEYKANNVINNTRDEVIKKILKLRAENKTPVDIQYRLELYGVYMELEDIKQLIYGELPQHLQEYFASCKSDWIQKMQTNSKEYRISLLEEFQIQLDRAKEYQSNCPDPEIAHAVGKDIKSLLDSIGKIAKDLDDIAPINTEKDRADQRTQELLSKTTKIVQLVPSEMGIDLMKDTLDIESKLN